MIQSLLSGDTKQETQPLKCLLYILRTSSKNVRRGVGGGGSENGTSKHQDRWPELERRRAQLLPDHTQAPAHDRSRKPLEPMRAGTAKPGRRDVTKQEAHTTPYGISTVLESCSYRPWPLGESKQLYSDGMIRPSGIPGLGYNQSSKLYQ